MKKYFWLLFTGLIFFSCSKEDLNKEQIVIIDKSRYENASSDPFTFQEVSIVGDSLRLTVQYGGGCGEVSGVLIDSGDIAESLPPQRFLRFIFTDQDMCEALVEKTFSFDIRPLKLQDITQIKLHLQDWETVLLYSY